MPTSTKKPPSVFSLLELLIVIAVLGGLLTLVSSFGTLDRFGLSRAARLAESHLVRARLHALAAREPVRVTLAGSGLQASDTAGAVITYVELSGRGLGGLDSVRLRPRTLRFNSRGHGSAGSIYLYRGRRGVRVVSNFVGRVRLVRFRT